MCLIKKYKLLLLLPTTSIISKIRKNYNTKKVEENTKQRVTSAFNKFSTNKAINFIEENIKELFPFLCCTSKQTF